MATIHLISSASETETRQMSENYFSESAGQILTLVDEKVGERSLASLARDNSPSDRVGDSRPLSRLLSGESRVSLFLGEVVLFSGLSNVSEYTGSSVLLSGLGVRCKGESKTCYSFTNTKFLIILLFIHFK